jgi:hypothetical protein
MRGSPHILTGGDERSGVHAHTSAPAARLCATEWGQSAAITVRPRTRCQEAGARHGPGYLSGATCWRRHKRYRFEGAIPVLLTCNASAAQ